jgi:hypothetical protein
MHFTVLAFLVLELIESIQNDFQASGYCDGCLCRPLPKKPEHQKQKQLLIQLQSGMGEALTQDLVNKGWRVAMADIQPNAELAEKLGESVSFHHCDVADYDSQARTFQEIWNKYGRLDALCANAGIVDKRYCSCMLPPWIQASLTPCCHSAPSTSSATRDPTSKITSCVFASGMTGIGFTKFIFQNPTKAQSDMHGYRLQGRRLRDAAGHPLYAQEQDARGQYRGYG